MTRSPDHWSRVWIAWVVGVLASFGIIEGTAIGTHRLDRTLSDNLRAWLGIRPRRPWRRAGMIGLTAALVGFGAWFLPHILGG